MMWLRNHRICIDASIVAILVLLVPVLSPEQLAEEIPLGRL
jgi:hypothetical protein